MCHLACDISHRQFELYSGSLLIGSAYKVTRSLNPSECLASCRLDSACASLTIDYKKSVCAYSSLNIRKAGSEKALRHSSHHNYYEKTCLNTTATAACRSAWVFERIKGRELVGLAEERITIPDIHSRHQCQIVCLEWREFTCRSAEFNYQMQECRLSPFNRFAAHDKTLHLESSRSIVDYLENNCAHEARGYCNWRAAKQYSILLADSILTSDSKEQCEASCMASQEFICRSYTWDSATRLCSLSHHTRRSLPSGALVKSFTSTLYEISNCFEGKLAILAAVYAY